MHAGGDRQAWVVGTLGGSFSSFLDEHSLGWRGIFFSKKLSNSSMIDDEQVQEDQGRRLLIQNKHTDTHIALIACKNNGTNHSQRSPLLAELIETRLIRTVSLRAGLRKIALPMASSEFWFVDTKEGLGIISGDDEKRAFGYEIVGFQVVPCSIERGVAAMGEHNKTLISRSALALFKLSVKVLSHGLKKKILEKRVEQIGQGRLHKCHADLGSHWQQRDSKTMQTTLFPKGGNDVKVWHRYKIFPQLVQCPGDDAGIGHFEWLEVIAYLKSPVPINVGSSLSSVEAPTNLNTCASVILVARLFKDKFKHLSALLLAIYLVISADANSEYKNH
ncbi:hypothetical protein VNO77_27372 [Canavalia gladiata]|uniref:Uncharacterized protein n=1 Tax=Canavalia gladiata TaxID=3824 RepID=A0AAN9KXR0_CANGL